MRDMRIRAAIGSLALIGLLCGCGTQTDSLVLVGEMEPAKNVGDAGNGLNAGSGLEPGGDGCQAAEPGDAPKIYVYVCGAVNRPGVVALPEGSRAEAALEAAGGFRQDAQTDRVNLAAKVADGEKLYFPTVEEAPNLPEDSGEDGLININTADEEALCTLPGIGRSKAGDILRYREENGPFGSCEDIMRVPGIKTSIYGRIKDSIRTE